MRHLIPIEEREREMDPVVHGLLPGDVIVFNTKAKAKLATFLILCVWGKSWIYSPPLPSRSVGGKN